MELRASADDITVVMKAEGLHAYVDALSELMIIEDLEGLAVSEVVKVLLKLGVLESAAVTVKDALEAQVCGFVRIVEWRLHTRWFCCETSLQLCVPMLIYMQMKSSARRARDERMASIERERIEAVSVLRSAMS